MTLCARVCVCGTFNSLNCLMISVVSRCVHVACVASDWDAVWSVDIVMSNSHLQPIHDVDPALKHSYDSVPHFYCTLIEHNAYDRILWQNPEKINQKKIPIKYCTKNFRLHLFVK